MAKVTIAALADTLKQLQDQLKELTGRIAALEEQGAKGERPNGSAQAGAAPAAAPAEKQAAAEAGITEEEMIAISAAIGAFLGVRAHIRQIRLVGTNAWSQQGRVSIQASHWLQG